MNRRHPPLESEVFYGTILRQVVHGIGVAPRSGVRVQLNRQSLRKLGRSRKESAFTLVEVLCAISIGAIAIAAMFSAFSNGYAILRTARDDERATQILEQKTEAIRLMTWSNLSNCPTVFQEYYNPVGSTNSTNVTVGTTYFGSINRFGDPTNLPSSVYYRSNVYLVTITLIWTNTANNKVLGHMRQAQTLLASQGMQSYLYGSGTIQ